MRIGDARFPYFSGTLKIIMILLGAAAVMLFFGKYLRQAAGILFGAMLIAFLLAPVCRWMEAKFRRKTASLLGLMAAALLFIGFAALLLPAILRQLNSLADLLPEAFHRVSDMLASIIDKTQAWLPGIKLPELGFDTLETDISSAAREAVATVGSLANGIYRLFLMVVLSYFLLADRERIFLRLELLIPLKLRRAVVRAGNSLVRELRLYLRGQATIALAVGSLATIAMLIIGLQGAPFLGLIVGICNVIPYFGPLLGGIPAVLAALSLGWKQAGFAILALFLVQQIDGFLISPRVMGNITGFSPAVVLIAVFLGAQAGGIGGMLFALPLLLGIRTLYRVFVQQHENN